MSRRKKVTQRDVVDGLRRLAFGDIQDAVTLLFESDEKILSVLPKLDLFNVSEIKKQKGGGMEIKFFDRIKALEKLREVIYSDDRQTAASFYEALEKSTQSEMTEGGEYFYE